MHMPDAAHPKYNCLGNRRILRGGFALQALQCIEGILISLKNSQLIYFFLEIFSYRIAVNQDFTLCQKPLVKAVLEQALCGQGRRSSSSVRKATSAGIDQVHG